MSPELIHEGEGIRRIQRGEDADALATAAYAQVIEVLSGLSPEEWQMATEYHGWTVRETVAHLIGTAGAHASVVEKQRQISYVDQNRSPEDDSGLGALTALYLLEQESVGDTELLGRLRMRAPRAVAGRIGRAQGIGSSHVPMTPSSRAPARPSSEKSLSELSNITLARDVWMHRLDIACATGRDLTFDPRVDGVLIVDMVADWSERHDAPVHLELTGPFGGLFLSRRAGPRLRLEALDFCRLATGREPHAPVPSSPLLEVQVPF